MALLQSKANLDSLKAIKLSKQSLADCLCCSSSRHHVAASVAEKGERHSPGEVMQ